VCLNSNSISKLKNLETQFARQLLKAFAKLPLVRERQIAAEIEIEAFCSASIHQAEDWKMKFSSSKDQICISL
jgi:hypothetical protein